MTGFSVFPVVLLLSFVTAAFAPPGLYDVQQVRLANGFRAILKKRGGTRNVSLRLAVNIGTRYFDCSRRETPHLVAAVYLRSENRVDVRGVPTLTYTQFYLAIGSVPAPGAACRPRISESCSVKSF